MQLSYTEENYIKKIYKLSAVGQFIVSTNSLANSLCISPAAITDMIQRLDNKKLIFYTKYQGVKLSPLGIQKARQALRRSMLWEIFLFKKLKLNFPEIEKISKELEYVQSTLLIQKISDYLENPSYSLHGEPIPDPDGKIIDQPQIALSQLELGQVGVVVALKDNSEPFLQYLAKRNIYVGVTIKVVEKISFDHSIDISIDAGNIVNISLKVSDSLLIVC